MKAQSIFILSAAIGLSAAANAALTNIVASGDFTDTGTFVVGTFATGINTATGFTGPNRMLIGTDGVTQTARNFDAAGTAGFGRMYAPESFDLAAQSVAIGDAILVEMIGLTIISDATDNNILELGLGNAGGVGAGNVIIGGALTHDLLGASPNLILAGGTSTGISFGTKFNYSVSLVAESAGAIASQTYTINHLVNGSSILSVPGQSIAASNGNANDTYLQGIVQDTDGNTFNHSNFTYEGFVLSTTVPEPSAALLGALGVLGLVRRRR